MNMGDFTSNNNLRLYRLLLTDGTSSTNFTVFQQQMDQYPLATYEPGKVSHIEQCSLKIFKNYERIIPTKH